jgi:hypothetical protein
MKTKIYFFILILLIVTGCSSVELTGSWIIPDAKPVEGKTIAIFCVTPKLNVREKVETQMCANLKAKGVDAISSLDFITPGKMDIEIIKTILKSKNVAGVIIVSLLDSQKETYYVPGTTAYYPASYGRPYYGYYGGVYSTVYDPGYYQTTTSYFIECNAYRLSDDQLVYSSQTKTVDPSNVDKFAYEFANVIVKDLVNKGVLAETKK